MGIDFDKMESTPFYRIMLLNPKGLDELWRIKKVMHPDNIKASRYVLFRRDPAGPEPGGYPALTAEGAVLRTGRYDPR